MVLILAFRFRCHQYVMTNCKNVFYLYCTELIIVVIQSMVIVYNAHSVHTIFILFWKLQNSMQVCLIQ